MKSSTHLPESQKTKKNKGGRPKHPLTRLRELLEKNNIDKDLAQEIYNIADNYGTDQFHEGASNGYSYYR